MKSLVITILLLSCCISESALGQGYSESFKFQSTDAQKAVRAYNKAIDDAKLKLQADLQKAMKVATRKSNVDEAIKLKKALDYLKVGNDPPRKHLGLMNKLNGTVWTWQKSAKGPTSLYKRFRGGKVYELHPKTGKVVKIETYVTTSPLSIRTSDGTNYIFGRNLTRYVTFNDRTGEVEMSSMRMGVRVKKK